MAVLSPVVLESISHQALYPTTQETLLSHDPKYRILRIDRDSSLEVPTVLHRGHTRIPPLSRLLLLLEASNVDGLDLDGLSIIRQREKLFLGFIELEHPFALKECIESPLCLPID